MAQEELGHSLNMQGYVRRVKDHLELNLARDVKDNKKGFSECISNKRKTRENVFPLLNGAGNLVTQDTEKAEVLTILSTSVFTGKTRLQDSGRPVGKSEVKIYPWRRMIRIENI
ncbi:glycerol kinase [Pitangus sulphuratus]|nr:glycerol kinase [Pitangus sulphuratus]